MKIFDPGHQYSLHILDGKTDYIQILTFVKRVGINYPGNKIPCYSGTNLQDVLRCVIDRTKYLNNQIPWWGNNVCIFLYRVALNLLELRAARRHNRKFKWTLEIEFMPFESDDGHIRFK